MKLTNIHIFAIKFPWHICQFALPKIFLVPETGPFCQLLAHRNCHIYLINIKGAKNYSLFYNHKGVGGANLGIKLAKFKFITVRTRVNMLVTLSVSTHPGRKK